MIGLLMALVGFGTAGSQTPMTSAQAGGLIVGGGLTVSTMAIEPDGSQFEAVGRGFLLAVGKPLELYSATGSTVCENASPVLDRPSQAGYGWQLVVVPVGLMHARDGQTELVLDLEWTRLWEAGKSVSATPVKRRVRLKNGSKLSLDQMPAAETPQCKSIGIALQVGRDASDGPKHTVAAPQRVARAWLFSNGAMVGGGPQMVALRLGERSEFLFPSIVDGDRSARIHGALTVTSVVGEAIHLQVFIARENVGHAAADGGTRGSSTYPIVMTPGETVELRVPLGSALGPFALRLQVERPR